MAKRKKTANYAVPALDKGLDILEALAEADRPLSLTDLSHSLNRTPSELFRMLNALERRAYILRDPTSEGYRLTLKLYELAHTHSPVDHLLFSATPQMRSLADTIHESCHLSVLSRGMLVVIAQSESPEPVRMSVEVGYRVPPLTTASGRTLVACLDIDERRRFLEADAVYATLTPREQRALGKEFEEIRKSGCLMMHSTRRTGYDIACIVGNARTGITAALAVPVILGGLNAGRERDLIPMVEQCARRITENLGLQPFAK